VAESGDGAGRRRHKFQDERNRSVLRRRLVYIANCKAGEARRRVDIDRPLLDVARLRLAEKGVTNCDFLEGDAYQLPKLVLHPVDFVFLANAFHGIPDKPRMARAVSAALVPGGRFAVVNWHQRPREQTVILGEPRGPKTG
jgi:SAM-dependent methyltransferase